MSLNTLQKFNNKISFQASQLESVAYLGQLALSNVEPAELMTQALSRASHGLSMEYALLLELHDDNKMMQVKTAYGWEDSPQQIPFEQNSLERFILGSGRPVILEDIQHENNSQFSNLLLQHQIVSGICTVIPGTQHPFGILGAFSRQKQTFTQEDIHFLHSIANIIALSIRNNHADVEWKIVQEDLKSKLDQIQALTRSGHWGTELDEVKSRMIESRERERLRLAQELHDVPIQDLYGLIYQLDDLSEFIREAEGKTILNDFHHTINRIINTLRTMCGELRPPSLSPFGLEVAIRDHVEKFREQNPGIEIHMNLMRDQQVLSDSLRLSLFRIYQQAMANVARHANATEVFIRFRWDEEVIVLEVEDNGIGFELPQQWVELVRQEHFGLMGVAERIESMHGRLEVISAPGNGTLIRASVPRYKK